MGSNKMWSENELEYLQDVWGEKTIPQIAKKLGRTITAVRLKAKRLNLGSQKWVGEMMSANKVAELLGVDIHTVTDYWILKYGLKGTKKRIDVKGKCIIIYFSDLIAWLENNQDKWDSRRVEYLALGYEYDWLIDKRESDKLIAKRRFQKWSAHEDARIICLFKTGRFTYEEIAKEMNRSANAVEHRLCRLDIWGTGKYKGELQKQKEKAANKANLEKRVLLQRLHDALLIQRNNIAFNGFWQKDMCMNWDNILGCTAEQINCDVCTQFKRIPPQYCVRCGGTFFERGKSRICERCRKARKAQSFKKHKILGRKFSKDMNFDFEDV